MTTATSVAPRTLPQRTAASATFAAAPVAASATAVAAPAATMPPPTTTTPWTVVAARSRRQPRSSSSSPAPTPDESYLDLRVSRLMFENYRFPADTRSPIKELATAVDRALSDPSGRKPRLRDAHRMATKDDTPFSARIVGDILRPYAAATPPRTAPAGSRAPFGTPLPIATSPGPPLQTVTLPPPDSAEGRTLQVAAETPNGSPSPGPRTATILGARIRIDGIAGKCTRAPPLYRIVFMTRPLIFSKWLTRSLPQRWPQLIVTLHTWASTHDRIPRT